MEPVELRVAVSGLKEVLPLCDQGDLPFWMRVLDDYLVRQLKESLSLAFLAGKKEMKWGRDGVRLDLRLLLLAFGKLPFKTLAGKLPLTMARLRVGFRWIRPYQAA